MQKLLLTFVVSGIIISLTSCATRTVVIDSQKDVIRVGKGVVGRGYIWSNELKDWIQVDRIEYPEGWFAGPMTLTNNF